MNRQQVSMLRMSCTVGSPVGVRNHDEDNKSRHGASRRGTASHGESRRVKAGQVLEGSHPNDARLLRARVHRSLHARLHLLFTHGEATTDPPSQHAPLCLGAMNLAGCEPHGL